MDFNEMIATEMDNLAKSGELATIIRTKLHGAITDVMKSAIGYGSPFQKTVEIAVKEAVQVEMPRVQLQTAMFGLGALVEAEVAQYVAEQSKEVLRERLATLFRPAPATLKLDVLLEKYLGEVKGDADEPGRIGLVFQPESNGKWLTIGMNPTDTIEKITYSRTEKNPITRYHDCDVVIHCNREDSGRYRPYHIVTGKHDILGKISSRMISSRELFAPIGDSFARFLFACYAQGTVLEIGSTAADDYELTYGEEE